MKLPNSENALVPKDKLENYLLSEIHPIGRFKAVFFKNLGYDDGDTDVLANDLSSIAQQEDFQTSSRQNSVRNISSRELFRRQAAPLWRCERSGLSSKITLNPG
jgi:hypothetical protein